MDCGFIEGDKRFRYRACAIIIEDGYILFAKNNLDDYYYSIGGAVQVGETAEEAVIREVLEETGLSYEIERLVFFHENFFNGSGTLEGLKCHEIALYFLMKPQGKKEISVEGYATCGACEHTYWLPLNRLKEYKAYPEFFAEKLTNMGDAFENIVTKDM